jgi:arylsulfatase
VKRDIRSQPNIILIMTDQQRYDTIGALGFPYMRTPNLDRLAREGVVFEQCYCTAPSCVPSRASFFNVQYPHTLKVYHNACPWERSWVEQFQTAGYHTVNIGKMHTGPMDAPCGFDQRFVVENKDRPLHLNRPHGNFYDEWDKFLSNSGVRKPSRHSYRAEHPDYETRLGAYEWPLEEKYHSDVFVGTMAEWFIEQRESQSPLFLQIGFPGPHPPYDPPKRFLEYYDGVELPVPVISGEELAKQPPPHAVYRREMIGGNHDAVRWHERPTREQLLRLRRHYAANVTLIDEQVGRVLVALERRGYLDNAVVLFMSDHGDCLGDHGHIQKWTMYDCITRMPTLVWAPGRLPAREHVDEMIQQMDLVPMLFELAGLEPPHAGAAVSALAVVRGESPGRDVVFAEHSADNILREVKFITMVRTRDWKLVHYLDQPWGELYDLQNDPDEVQNLWDDIACDHAREELLAVLRDWRVRDSLRLPSGQALKSDDTTNFRS